MAEKKEKQYVSDNAQLMTEWNWERNIDIEPSQVTLGSGKKYGGYAAKDTNGKRPYIAKIKVTEARIALVGIL